MRQECPVLTYYYIQYALWWFVVGCFVTAVITMVNLARKQKVQICGIAVCVLSGVVMAVWYVMTAVGAWDYKNALFAGCFWIIWMIVTAVKGVEEEQ